MSTKKIIEYAKMLGMTIIFTMGQVIGFGAVSIWAIYNEVKDEKISEED